MSPTLFLGSLVVAGVLSGLLHTSQAPAPSVSTQPATPEQTPQDVQLAVWRAATLLQLARAAHADASPDVVCGMKLWRVNPDVDTAIHRQIPEEAFNATTRRIVPDGECGASARAVTPYSVTTTIHSAGVKKPDPRKPDPPVRK